MAGHTVHAICPGKKAGEKVRTAIHDFEGDPTYSEKRGHDFALNASFEQVRVEDFRRCHSRRRAPEYIRLNERVLLIVKHFAAKNCQSRPSAMALKSSRCSGSTRRQRPAAATRPCLRM